MNRPKVSDVGKRPDSQLLSIVSKDLMPLPVPCGPTNESPIRPLPESKRNLYECSLDGVSALSLPKPKTKEEEQALVRKFLSGLHKLLSKENNWTFLQPLMLSLHYCAKCLVCNEDCPVYVSSGRQEIYRPNYRSEILRRLVAKYVEKGPSAFTEGDIDLNWATVARLAELSYRCTICRRCAQACSRGVDNGLITHELRKLFSQEMGIAPRELHDMGSVQQLKVGASTGMTPDAFKNIVHFMETEIEEKTGKKITIPVDKVGADILLIHNTGEFMSWMENPEAFAIIFEAAGLSWTLSSELGGYEGTNYGVWYDDVQFARIALKHMDVAKRLKVKKIVIGECGHSHKALTVIADRLLNKDNCVPRESSLPLLEQIVSSGKLHLDPKRNDFPVTLHDPCNIVRLMGIVEPQRKILRQIAPQFREMTPKGVENYCCGGGSGFAIINSSNFPDWKMSISGRMKIKQVLDAFADVPAETNKYLCAPCSNCKGQLRDLLDYYELWTKHHVYYGGLVELIVNAMTDIKQPFITWEWR